MKFTVFTPTYNRASLIHRVYDSLMMQSIRDFEWIVIDDGSNDNTSELIESYKKEADFKIKYLYQENKGKVSAINSALEIADGFFFLVFDSDDWCVDDALERIYSEWLSIPDTHKASYAAVSCLKIYADGSVVGEDYNRMPKMGASYIDRFNNRIKGDKWECIITDIHKKYKYDLSQNERYMAPEYSWLGIGCKYKTLFINEPLSIIEYQTDGISRNNIKHRANNAKSTVKFYERAHLVSRGLINKVKVKVNLSRFYLHDLKVMKSFYISTFLFPIAVALYLNDLKKIKR
ncbi:glycosyltransferase family A protein [Pseudoalteromonas sp. TB51]|uniref:glycosyltransferase family A protein n=1 Tax=Pseudoalteromonas sp. TB51 TaxID=1055803 RepID=UPI0003F6BA37|nr:glycosyltransferase family A protein [Pseudoalteromonas sp. TB51]